MTKYEKFIKNRGSAMVNLMDALIKSGYTEEEAGHMLAAAIDEHDALWGFDDMMPENM